MVFFVYLSVYRLMQGYSNHIHVSLSNFSTIHFNFYFQSMLKVWGKDLGTTILRFLSLNQTSALKYIVESSNSRNIELKNTFQKESKLNILSFEGNISQLHIDFLVGCFESLHNILGNGRSKECGNRIYNRLHNSANSDFGY